VNDSDRKRFADALQDLQASYKPFFGDLEAWRRTVGAYWRRLELFDWVDVDAAIVGAHVAYPHNMPSAGQLQILASSSKARRGAARQAGGGPVSDPEDPCWHRPDRDESHPLAVLAETWRARIEAGEDLDQAECQREAKAIWKDFPDLPTKH
jgi:hypothetical protein